MNLGYRLPKFQTMLLDFEAPLQTPWRNYTSRGGEWSWIRLSTISNFSLGQDLFSPLQRRMKLQILLYLTPLYELKNPQPNVWAYLDNCLHKTALKP